MKKDVLKYLRHSSELPSVLRQMQDNIYRISDTLQVVADEIEELRRENKVLKKAKRK